MIKQKLYKDSFSAYLSRLKKEVVKRMVIPRKMEEAGYVIDEDLQKQGILCISHVYPKKKAPPV